MNSMHATIKRCLIGAYASFLVATAICFLLYPSILDHCNYGISYFGSVRVTMLPYYLGLVGTIMCLVVIARQLHTIGRSAQPFSLGFWGAAILLGGVAATSYSVSHSVFVVHMVFDIVLILNQLAVTTWMLLYTKVAVLDYVLTSVLVVTVIISILPLIHHLPVIRSFPLREVVIFVCALALMGRPALGMSEVH